MNTRIIIPRRGEIWNVNLDPTEGAEIKKTRPAVVINSDGVAKLSIRLIAPITEWKPKFANNIWLVKISPTSKNGLQKESAVDTLQLRGVDTSRFVDKLGEVDAGTLEEIAAAVAAVVEYE